MALLKRRNPEPVHKTYRTYKKYLREDFQYRCVYCDIHENEYGGLHHFHVDHFRPYSLPQFANLETDYRNLLCSCGLCNKRKGDDWPSDDPLADGVGYLDPCEHDFDLHFATPPGDPYEITGLTAPARYMVVRLRLNRRQLVVIRRRRQERERRYQATIRELDSAIRRVELALQRAPAKRRNAWNKLRVLLLAERDEIERQWRGRWVPEFEDRDYR